MQVRFNANLGLLDAKAHHLDASKCKLGDVADISEAAFKALSGKYPALFEALDKPVRGVAKPPVVTAVPPKPESEK